MLVDLLPIAAALTSTHHTFVPRTLGGNARHAPVSAASALAASALVEEAEPVTFRPRHASSLGAVVQRLRSRRERYEAPRTRRSLVARFKSLVRKEKDEAGQVDGTLVDVSVAVALTGAVLFSAADIATAGFATATAMVASEDAGPVGRSIRAIGNATMAGYDVAKQLEQENELGLWVRGAFEVAKDIAPRLKSVANIVEGIDPPPPPPTRLERMSKRIDDARGAVAERAATTRLAVTERVGTTKTVVTERVEHVRASVPSTLLSASNQRVAMGALLVLCATPPMLKAGAWAGGIAVDAAVLAGAYAKLSVARVLLWLSSPLVALLV